MTELNGVPIPNPSDGQPPVTPPSAPQAPDAYSTPPAPGAYPASAPPAPVYAQPTAVVPGRTLGIVGLILAFFVSPAGIIVSAIGLHKSRKAGNKNGFALAGLILSIVFFIVTVVIIVAVVGVAVALLSQCADLGGGVQEINGVTVTCPTR